jgi:hypothetical protein
LRILYVRFPWRINSSSSIIHHGILARPKVTSGTNDRGSLFLHLLQIHWNCRL